MRTIIPLSTHLAIYLPREIVALVDYSDRDIAESAAWYALTEKHPYVLAHCAGRTLYLHSVIMARLFPEYEGEVDHKNRNPLDNRRQNLRIATRSENCANSRGRGRSQFRGVAWHKRANKWVASLRLNKKQIHLGYFSSETAAARAYDVRAKVVHGEFANLNFPE
jgi:hypothetical protein